MKKALILCVLFGPAALVSSCAEEEEPAYVWGTVSANVIDPKPPTLNGSLDKGGERYFGFCEYDDKAKTFSFGVGSGKPGLGKTSDWYLMVEGIQGPPQEGAFGADGSPKSGEMYQATFKRAVVTQLYSWVVSGGEVDGDYCNVRLFAEAGDGEVEPYTQRRFRYYAELQCSSIEIADQNETGVDLTSFDAALYFKGCK